MTFICKAQNKNVLTITLLRGITLNIFSHFKREYFPFYKEGTLSYTWIMIVSDQLSRGLLAGWNDNKTPKRHIAPHIHTGLQSPENTYPSVPVMGHVYVDQHQQLSCSNHHLGHVYDNILCSGAHKHRKALIIGGFQGCWTLLLARQSMGRLSSCSPDLSSPMIGQQNPKLGGHWVLSL